MQFLPERPEWLTVKAVVTAGIAGAVFSAVWEECVSMQARRRRARQRDAPQKDTGGAVNPFMNSVPQNFYQWRYLWPGIVLIPIRFALFVSGILGVSCVGYLVGVLAPPKGGLKEKPLGGWRKSMMLFASQWSARLLLWGVGVNHIEVVGERAGPTEAPIVVSNHRGPIEAFYFIAFHDVCCVSASENRFPVLKYGLDGMQVIFVDRTDPNARKVVSDTIKSRAKAGEYADGSHWPQLFLFPEGTTTNGTAVIKFKLGAFTPGVPVQPVAVEFPNDHLDTDPSFILGVRGPMFGLPKIFLRMMASWNNPMRVTYLPVVNPTEELKANPPQFAEQVRGMIAGALGVPMTDHEIEDMMLAITAVKSGMTAADGAIEFGKIKALCNMTGKEAKELLEKFRALDVDKDGELTPADVAVLLDLPPDGEILKGLFRTLSQRRDGTKATINFREFLTGVAKASGGMTASEKAEFIFTAFDLDGSGTLCDDELFCMMKLGFETVTPEYVANMRRQITSNPTVRKEEFVEFLAHPDNKAHLFLFDLLRKAKTDAGPVPLTSLDRHASFIRHREEFLTH
eukprot:TRINITY_DN20821_c0_g1_i1.p1 TRINITY_DN20821_c0_g1~~TRINITY_DN20821_c0_g1_i1.p1  ORF type:complete len:569 (+),score=191.23 TRINITY_DN20821_c0_g1_i1:75-1781(+)